MRRKRKLYEFFRTSFIFAVLASVISGCVTPQDVHQANERQCLSYGFRQATNDFAQCMQRESLAERYSWGDSHSTYIYPWW